MMNASTQFKEYEDRYGLIQPEKGKTSGNGLLYTAEMLINLYRLGFLKDTDYAKYLQNILNCQEVPGLYNRSPENTDQEGIDDYIGLATVFFILERFDLANNILQYGRKNNFIYNNARADNKSSWFWRFPHVLCHFYWASDQKPNLFLQLYWVLERLVTVLILKKANQDAIILGYLLGLVARGRSKWIDKVLLKFEDKVFSLYPGGYAEVISSYLNTANHPLVEYWPYSIFEHAVIHDK